MQSIILRTATAALFAATIAPAAFAQSASRTQPVHEPYNAATRAPVCTQLELNAGLSGDECGKLSLSEIAFLKTVKDNTN